MYFSINMVHNHISVIGFLLKVMLNEWEQIMVYSVIDSKEHNVQTINQQIKI